MNNQFNDIDLKNEETQAVLESIPSWIIRNGILVVFFLIVFLFSISMVFKYPDTISAPMTLTNYNPARAIIARSSGRLQYLYVENNQHVIKGQYLAIIETSASISDVEYIEKYLNDLTLNIDTIIDLPPSNLKLGTMQTSYSNFYTVLLELDKFRKIQYYPHKNQIIEQKLTHYQDNHRNLLKQHTLFVERVNIKKKQYQRDSTLNKKGVIAFEELESSKNDYLQASLDLENSRTTIQNMEIQNIDLQNTLFEINSEYEDKNKTLEVQLLAETSQLTSAIQEWKQTYLLQSPIDGIVIIDGQLVTNQNVDINEKICTIVPQEDKHLFGKIRMPISRSGKVKIGQKVNIYFDNFPTKEYGIVLGTITDISPIPAKYTDGTDYYSAKVELTNGLTTSYKKELPYLPEMQAQIEIITDDTSLFERIIMPIKKIWIDRIN